MKGLLETRSDGGLWAAHVPAFRAFLAAATQWRTRLVATEAGWRNLVIGLDYASARVAHEALGLVLTPAQWSQFTALEREAAEALNGASP